jgi:hypothetical protein
MVELTFKKIMFIGYSLTTGLLLFYSPNKDIIEVCPNSNIWYLAFLSAISIEPLWVLIPFDIHEILDECNRKKLSNSAPYILLAAPYFIIGLVVLGMISSIVVGVIVGGCSMCLAKLAEMYPRPQQRQAIRMTETTVLTV